MKVSQLIEELQKLPPEQTVVIDDADTNWPMNIKFIESRTDREGGEILCFIGGGYNDVWEKE